MLCPNDHSELKKASYHGVSIYECPKCHGMWFPQDELRIAKDNTDEDLRWLDFDLFAEKTGKFALVAGEMKCPKCGKTMQAKKYAGSGVIINVCPDQHGVWLDKGEFQKIIHYLEGRLVREPSGELAKDMVKQFEEIATGPEGAISELKDFLAVTKLYEMRLTAEHPWLDSVLTTYYAVTPFK